MIKFNELKNQIIMKNGEQYFKEEDLKYWGTDTSKIEAIKKDKIIIILDNADDFLVSKKEYRIKIYDIKYKKINTLYITDNVVFAKNLLAYFKNYKSFDAPEINILMTGEIEIVNNQTIVKSAYLNKEFLLFDLVEFLK